MYVNSSCRKIFYSTLYLMSEFLAVLLENNKRLRGLLEGRSMPKKVRYTVKSGEFGRLFYYLVAILMLFFIKFLCVFLVFTGSSKILFYVAECALLICKRLHCAYRKNSSFRSPLFGVVAIFGASQ